MTFLDHFSNSSGSVIASLKMRSIVFVVIAVGFAFEAPRLMAQVAKPNEPNAGASLLTILEKQFGLEWKDLREVPVFADFVKSPQYAKWAETQKANNKK